MDTPHAHVAALASLGPPGVTPDSALVPALPGLYAVHASDDVWIELGLGQPPDGRPLYVGKAERSLASRDVETHFSSGRTGSSTLRRTLAALLKEPLDLRACPRNVAKPDGSASYGLEPDSDQRLTEWMHAKLQLAIWPAVMPCVLDDVETAVLVSLEPPLNIMKVRTKWTDDIKRRRAEMAAEARAWQPPPPGG